MWERMTARERDRVCDGIRERIVEAFRENPEAAHLVVPVEEVKGLLRGKRERSVPEGVLSGLLARAQFDYQNRHWN